MRRSKIPLGPEKYPESSVSIFYFKELAPHRRTVYAPLHTPYTLARDVPFLWRGGFRTEGGFTMRYRWTPPARAAGAVGPLSARGSAERPATGASTSAS